MKRRAFVKAQSLFTVSAFTLPIGVLTPRSCTPVIFDGRKTLEANKEEKFEIEICIDIFKDFDIQPKANKQIKLSILYYPNKNQTKNVNTYIALYTLKNLRESSNNTYHFQADFISASSLDYPIHRIFSPKTIHFKYQKDTKFHTLSLYDKNDEMYVHTRYQDVNEKADDDCFITSATLAQVGKTDSGIELESIRFLRDQYMVHSEKGRHLIAEYEQLAPEILNKIHKFQNQREIFDAIYQQLIIPCLHFINKQQYEAAVIHYTDFVNFLKKQYL